MKALATILVLLAAAPAPADPAPPSPRVYHIPAAEAAPGQPFVLRAEVERSWQAPLELHYRAIGAAEWRIAPFQRGAADGNFQVTVPPDIVRPPGFDYFIESVAKDGSTTLHFASPDDPYRVVVHEDAGVIVRARELARYHGSKARVRVAAEWVDFGSRHITGVSGAVPDSYYRLDGDITFRLLRLPLHSLRFGATRLIGETPATVRDDGTCEPSAIDPGKQCSGEAGFSVAPWAEVGLRLTDLVHIDLRLIFAATKTGFTMGGRGELRFGTENGAHLAVGAEGIGETGYAAFVRLGWDTVPHLPMAATIEVTDYPAAHRASAVRLIYDIAYPMQNGVTIGLRAGYQARDQGIGGPTLGLNAGVDW